jgi:RHS repeat-associated protein
MQLHTVASNTSVYPNTKYLEVDKMTIYPNGYINIDQDGNYTKHYYADEQRIASKIGTGFVYNGNLCDKVYEIPNLTQGYLANKQQIQESIMQDGLGKVIIPEESVLNVQSPYSDLCNLEGDLSLSENELFFYHGDHLSSTQMVTDISANVTQQILYAPFGEVLSEYNAYWHNGQIPDYMFNAKELDEESGMYYYSARYYAPPVFTSRDALFEKYPWISPYAYCMNNPVILIDPTGEDVEIVCPLTNQTVNYTPGMAVPEGASQFVKKAINSLNRINSTEVGRELVSELKDSEHMYKIKQSENNMSSFTPTDVYESANPDASEAKKSAGAGGTISWYEQGRWIPTLMGPQKDATIDLAHELFHGLDANRGLRDSQKENGIPRNEWQASYRENMLRPQLNLPLRTYYRVNQYGGGEAPRLLDGNNQPIKPYWYPINK